ncbi:MAG: hypothetical protein IPK64_18635 [bacterium]|nr:hypothetical protein [bacterium]
MNNVLDIDHDRVRYECVQPELGAELWRRDLPDCAPELATRLDRHLAVCDACRLEGVVQAALAAGLVADALGKVKPARTLRLRPSPVATGGWVALAASLALALLLPPGALPVGTTRGGQPVAGFVRPVEGEVVADTPDLRWHPVPGATGYQVTLDQVGGDFHWSARVDASRLEPAGERAPREPGRYRVIVRAIPDDLTPPEGISVTFRRGSGIDQFIYRLWATSWPIRLLGLAGLVLGLSGLVRRQRSLAA